MTPTERPKSQVDVNDEATAKWVVRKLNDCAPEHTVWASGSLVCSWSMTQNDLAAYVEAALE